MAEKDAADELSRVLALEGETVQVAGEELTIKPFRLKQFVCVLKCVSDLGDKGVIELPGKDGKSARDFSFPKMLLKGGDSVIEILAIATGREIAWLENLDTVEAVKLCATVWGVNKSFFLRNQETLSEALGPLWALVGTKLSALGQTSSKASSQTATGSKK